MDLYAFWPCNESYTGGEVIEMMDNGRVKVKGYPGFLFRPVKLVPIKTGKKLKEKLEELQHSYTDSLQQLNLDFRKDVEALLDL